MITRAEVEATQCDYARAQALADEAYAAMLPTRALGAGPHTADASAALDAWVRRREAADALAMAYFNASRALGQA